jgi:5'-nucleotidase
MSAAMEASIEGIPSIGFSLMEYGMEADFSASREVVRTVVKKILAQPQPDHLLLNVNIPYVSIDEIKGIKICRQAFAKYREEFDERRDPHGRKYYWLTGEFLNLDTGNDTDVWALQNNYVSVVPVSIDFTDHKLKAQLEKKWVDNPIPVS